MLDILSITTPIYILIALGYVLTKSGVWAKSDMKILGQVVIQLALPALVFESLSQRDVLEILNLPYLSAYTLGSLCVMGFAYFVSKWSEQPKGSWPTFMAMGMSCSNSGFIGFPVLLLYLGPVAGVALALNMVVENLLLIPILLFMAQRSALGAGVARQTVQDRLIKLFASPLILSLIAGVFMSILGWRLPQPLAKSVDLLAHASSALSLLVIGGTLVGLPWRAQRRSVGPIVVGKLVLHPLMVYGSLVLLSSMGLGVQNVLLSQAAIVMAAMPTMSIFVTLAQSHGHEDQSAMALLLTTVCSFFTLSGLLWVLRA